MNGQHLQLTIEVRQEGAMVLALLGGDRTAVLASISTAACNLDPEVLEDFQALVLKAFKALVESRGAEVHSFCRRPPGGEGARP